MFSDYVALDRLVAATRAATTAGAGFPTQSQRRWWSPLEWRFYSRLDKAADRPGKARSSAESPPGDRVGGKGWQPAADGRGRTAARTGCVVFVGHMHASEN